MHINRILKIALITGFLLLIPLIAMQFTSEMNWSPFDFIVAGIFIFVSGLAYELIAKKSNAQAYRIAVGIAVATAFLLNWANLAVGLIGNEENPANLMYFGVLAIGIIGALISRFRPQGMAYALYATALAQMLVALIAQIMGLGFTYLLNGAFATLWIISGLFFQRAAQNSPITR